MRLATTDVGGNSISIPLEVQELGELESGAADCQTDGSVTCYTGGTGGEGNTNTNSERWSTFDVRESGRDWEWRENYMFDPIPSAFLRHSASFEEYKVLHTGGRGALRKWWGWDECTNPDTGKLHIDEAWSFPSAPRPNQPEPKLLNASLPPSGVEVITEIHTPKTPLFKGFQCYAETITAYFRPKRSARYAFKLWSNECGSSWPQTLLTSVHDLLLARSMPLLLTPRLDDRTPALTAASSLAGCISTKTAPIRRARSRSPPRASPALPAKATRGGIGMASATTVRAARGPSRLSWLPTSSTSCASTTPRRRAAPSIAPSCG